MCWGRRYFALALALIGNVSFAKPNPSGGRGRSACSRTGLGSPLCEVPLHLGNPTSRPSSSGSARRRLRIVAHLRGGAKEDVDQSSFGRLAPEPASVALRRATPGRLAMCHGLLLSAAAASAARYLSVAHTLGAAHSGPGTGSGAAFQPACLLATVAVSMELALLALLAWSPAAKAALLSRPAISLAEADAVLLTFGAAHADGSQGHAAAAEEEEEEEEEEPEAGRGSLAVRALQGLGSALGSARRGAGIGAAASVLVPLDRGGGGGGGGVVEAQGTSRIRSLSPPPLSAAPSPSFAFEHQRWELRYSSSGAAKGAAGAAWERVTPPCDRPVCWYYAAAAGSSS